MTDLKSKPLSTSVDGNSVMFGAVSGQGDSDPDVWALSTLWSYIRDQADERYVQSGGGESYVTEAALEDELEAYALASALSAYALTSALSGYATTGALSSGLSGKQDASSNLSEWSAINPSTDGGSLVAAANFAAMRTLLDLEPGTDFYSMAAANSAFQAANSNLSEWATVNPSDNGKALVAAADYAAMKVLLDLEIGTDLQAYSAGLGQIAGLSAPGADRLLFWDHSASSWAHLSLGDNLSITGTTLNAAGGGGGGGGAGADYDENAVITWDTDDITLTHSSGLLALDGGDFRVNGKLFINGTDVFIEDYGWACGLNFDVATGANIGYHRGNTEFAIGIGGNAIMAVNQGGIRNCPGVIIKHNWMTGPSPVSLDEDGQFTLTFTSNTNVRISGRGTDGTTRVANITLA